MGLFEVIADDLLELRFGLAIRVDPLLPVGEACVQARARTLQQALVRGVAHEDVLETEAAILTANQLLSTEGRELALELRADRVGYEDVDGLVGEVEADHGRGLDDGALVPRQKVEAGFEQCVN